MKKTKFALLPLILAVLTMGFGACSSDAEYTDNTDTHDCVLTKITLGTLKRNIQVTKDSVYTVTLNGGYYPLTIDQNNNRIYNVDSLPVGTDVKHVTFATLTTTGVATIRSLATDKDTLFSSTDSTDFSVLRYVTVNAYDGLAKKTYEVDIRVHQEEADSFVWKNVQAGNAVLKQFEGNHRSLGRADSALLVFGQIEGQPQVVTIAPSGSISKHALPTGFEVISVVANPGQTVFYALISGSLSRSSNGIDWENVEAANVPSQLLAVGSTGLYGLKDGAFYSSTDGGKTWQADGADEMDKVPASNVAGAVTTLRTDNRMESVIVVGQLQNGRSVVWIRNIDLTGVNSFDWYCLPEIIGQEHANLATINAPSLFTYDNALWIVGHTAENTLSPLYISQDNGRTWSVPTKHVKNPLASLIGQAATASGAATANNFVWIVESTTGQLWRGRYNRLGWKNEQTSFEKSARQELGGF